METKLPNEFQLGKIDDLFDTILDISKPLKTHKYFTNNFYPHKLWIWIICFGPSYSILCVKRNSKKINHDTYLFDALIINHIRQYQFKIILNNNSKKSVIESFMYKTDMIYVKDRLFAESLSNIDMHYDSDIKYLTVGVINVLENQTSRDEWFENKETPQFEKFVKQLGCKLFPDNWNGCIKNVTYLGETKYKHWKGVLPVAYHITPRLSSEERRGLVGNDLLLILFVTRKNNGEDLYLDLSNLSELGRMPQCIAIVTEADNSNYYLRFVYKSDSNFVENEKYPNAIKQPLKYKYIEFIILHKFHMVMRYLYKCKDFKKIYTEPRKKYIESLVKMIEPHLSKSSTIIDTSKIISTDNKSIDNSDVASSNKNYTIDSISSETISTMESIENNSNIDKIGSKFKINMDYGNIIPENNLMSTSSSTAFPKTRRRSMIHGPTSSTMTHSASNSPKKSHSEHHPVTSDSPRMDKYSRERSYSIPTFDGTSRNSNNRDRSNSSSPRNCFLKSRISPRFSPKFSPIFSPSESSRCSPRKISPRNNNCVDDNKLFTMRTREYVINIIKSEYVANKNMYG